VQARAGQDRVAGDAEKRLRELQVGSPVELKLTLTRPYADVVARRRNVVRRGQGNDVALRHSSPRNVET
jgi:hypothetical protein